MSYELRQQNREVASKIQWVGKVINLATHLFKRVLIDVLKVAFATMLGVAKDAIMKSRDQDVKNKMDSYSGTGSGTSSSSSSYSGYSGRSSYYPQSSYRQAANGADSFPGF